MKDVFGYSDGDATETYLLEVLKQASDVSCGSVQLAKAIRDWPSEYHFSPVRHNLMRPFEILPSQQVLELGCGCGAMTRYFGETGAAVVGIEGSKRRAEIATERCRDLPNVRIHSDNFIDFRSDEKFDYVTLIGVLEYAPIYIDSPDPIEACLKHARSFLKEDGALILAIENQLGLKYFNGCNEDHRGVPYYGINGLYGSGEAETFGHRVLAEELRKVGFAVQQFYYPFPDYKVPGLVLSDAAFQRDHLNVPDLLISNVAREYPENHRRAFAEDLAWRVVGENHLIPHLANSFLVFARKDASRSEQPNWLAKMYNRGRRRPCYEVESTIEEDEVGRLVVTKRKLHSDADTHQNAIRHIVTDSTYIKGNLLIGKIHRAMAREAEMEELSACFRPWLDFLMARASTNNAGERVLPGDFADCIPANLVEGDDDRLHYFDAEWVSGDPVPFSWVVVRGIIYSLIGCLENSAITGISYRTLIDRLLGSCGVYFSDHDFKLADEWEFSMVEQCHIDAIAIPRIAKILSDPVFSFSRLSSSPDVNRSLVWHKAELARVKSSVSWRITAPLRVIWNLYLRIMRREKK